MAVASPSTSDAQTRAKAIRFENPQHTGTVTGGTAPLVTHYQIVTVAPDGTTPVFTTAPILKAEFTAVAGTSPQSYDLTATKMAAFGIPTNRAIRAAIVALNLANPVETQSSGASELTADSFFLPAPPARPSRPALIPEP